MPVYTVQQGEKLWNISCTVAIFRQVSHLATEIFQLSMSKAIVAEHPYGCCYHNCIFLVANSYLLRICKFEAYSD